MTDWKPAAADKVMEQFIIHKRFKISGEVNNQQFDEGAYLQPGEFQVEPVVCDEHLWITERVYHVTTFQITNFRVRWMGGPNGEFGDYLEPFSLEHRETGQSRELLHDLTKVVCTRCGAQIAEDSILWGSGR